MKMEFEIVEGTYFNTTFNGTVEDYALMWLNLTNNAREYTNEFYKIENNCNNDVYITCDRDSAAEVKDYLERLGLIINEEKEVNVVVPTADCESEKEYDYVIANVESY